MQEDHLKVSATDLDTIDESKISLENEERQIEMTGYEKNDEERNDYNENDPEYLEAEAKFNNIYNNGPREGILVKYWFKNIFLVGPGYEWISPLVCMSLALVIDLFGSYVSSCEESQDYVKFIHWAAAANIMILFWTAFTNPGHKQRKMTYPEFLKAKEADQISCYQCLTLKTDGCTHCEDCGLCVEALDHHCVVMGNCIAKYNLIPFYFMLGFCLVGFVIVYVIIILSIEKCYDSKKKVL